MNAKQLMRRFLEEEGFRYEWDEECVCFKFQGLIVNVLFYDNIDNLLSLAITYDVDDISRYAALNLCNDLNRTSVLKHYLIDDTLVILFDEYKKEVEVSNESVMENLELFVQGAITCWKSRSRLTPEGTVLLPPCNLF